MIICFIFLMFIPMVITNCVSDRKTIMKIINEYDQYYGYRRDKKVEVCETKTITCTNVKFPLSDSSEVEDCPVFLYITNSNISTVPHSAFSAYNLITLHMNYLGIQEIIPGTFTSLTSLKEIYLSGNNLTDVIPGVFSALPKLTVLDLSHNNIEELIKHFLTGVDNLKMLNLSSNMLSTFDTSLSSSFKSIENVDVSYNLIKNLDFDVFESAEVLNVSHNEIEELETCILKIRVVNLSNNKLTSLKNENCSDHDSLTKDLDASYNNISVIDVDLFKSLRSLQKLQLQFNNIECLDVEVFSYHTNLIYLDLSHNKIQSLEHGLFERMESLAYLNISYNHLTNIDVYLYSLYNLVELNIESNQISSLNSEVLSHFGDLRILNIDKNKFSCQNLINILRSTKSLHINVLYGDSKNVSNIHGIACSDVTNEVTSHIMTKMSGFPNDSDQRNFMNDYLNKDFKSSNFYKYLESLERDDSVKISDSKIIEYFEKEFPNSALYKLLEKLVTSENSTANMNKSFYDYFNRDFKNSGFVRYLEGFRTNTSNENSKINMYDYFNTGFRNSSFFKYLEHFRNAEFLATDDNVTKGKQDYATLFVIVILILLILVVVNVLQYSLLFFYFKNYDKRGKDRSEQVELI